MSWLFSRALVEEYSAAILLDGELSAPSNGHHTQLAYLSHGKTTAFSRLSRFGMTCKPLTDAHGEALLTSYLADSRARTSASQGGAPELKASAPACGSTWPALSVRFDPAESKWKTAHCLWEEDLPWSSVTLPPWGMTRSGFVYQHPTAERPISATAAGSSAFEMGLTMKPTHSIPTPTASDHIERQSTSREALNFETNKTVSLDRWVKYWTTPSASDGSRGGKITENMTGTSLAQQVNTPRCWPTATATAHKGWSVNHNRASSDDRLDYSVEREAHEAGAPGRLNPEWVEWLMGWPLGWTDLKPLAMDRFREWQQQHSPCSQEAKAA